MKSLNIKFVTFSYTPKNPSISFISLSLSLSPPPPTLALSNCWTCFYMEKIYFFNFLLFYMEPVEMFAYFRTKYFIELWKMLDTSHPTSKSFKKMSFCQPEAKKNRKWIWMWHFYICNGFKFKTYPTTKTYQNMLFSYHKIQNLLKAR